MSRVIQQRLQRGVDEGELSANLDLAALWLLRGMQNRHWKTDNESSAASPSVMTRAISASLSYLVSRKPSSVIDCILGYDRLGRANWIHGRKALRDRQLALAELAGRLKLQNSAMFSSAGRFASLGLSLVQ